MAVGDKKHVIAEQLLRPDESINLCNLYRTDWQAFEVLSVYSTLSKQLLAYKVMHKGHAEFDEWLSMPFNQYLIVNQLPNVQILPNQFTQRPKSEHLPFVIESQLPKGHQHILEGICQAQVQKGNGQNMYLLYDDNQMLLVVFNQKQLVFSNVFVANNEQECLYFIVAAMHAAQMQQDQVDVWVTYDLWQNAKMIDALKPYVKSIQCMQITGEFGADLPDLKAWLLPNDLTAQCA